MNPDKILAIRQMKIINELKAEITYWRETSEEYKDRCYNLEQHNNYLINRLNKTFDKEKSK